jgi:hypothetical protein
MTLTNQTSDGQGPDIQRADVYRTCPKQSERVARLYMEIP